MPAYMALQADMIPREKRGRIMGTNGTLNVMATIPASALVGFLYGMPVACGAISRLDAQTGEIKRVFVKPEARGLGLSKLMITRLEKEAMAIG